jgi:Flp pilus assembly pilin Flp
MACIYDGGTEMCTLANFWLDESGQDLTEYGLLAALVSLASVIALTAAGTRISALWSVNASKITDALK